MLAEEIIKNILKGIENKVIYNYLVDSHIENCLDCGGRSCGHLEETKKIIHFFIKEQVQRRKIEKNNKEFWAGVCHDIKSPMLSIDYALKNHTGEDVLKTVYETNLSSLELIRKILENYSFETGILEKKPENTPIKRLFENLEHNYSYMLKSKNIKIKLDNICEKLILHACPVSVHRIFSNLFTNAIKFALPNSSVTIEAQKNNGELLVSISNNGEKIKNPKNIFKKFVSYEGSSVLGLYICKKIIEELGGKIWASNNEDGVKFSVLFQN